MRKNLFLMMVFFVILTVSVYAADTFTTNLKLTKPGRGSSGWDTKINVNYDTIDTAYGTIQSNVADMTDVVGLAGTFNSTTGVTVTLPKTVASVNDYQVNITTDVAAPGAAIGDISVVKGVSSFIVYNTGASTADTFIATVHFDETINAYGEAVRRRYIISPLAAGTDHGDDTIAGTIADVENDVISGIPATMVLPGNNTYEMKQNITLAATTDVTFDGGAIIDTDLSIVNGTYQWCLSANGTTEYWLALVGGSCSSPYAGSDPSIASPSADVHADNIELTEASAGSLQVSQWEWTDNEPSAGLGFSTIYVRLADSADPDSKATDFVEAGYTLTINGSIRADNSQIFTGNGLVTIGEKIPEVNVKWFGAVGDGSTEDYVPFQSAINTTQAKKATLIIPYTASGYKIDSKLFVTNPIVLKGLGVGFFTAVPPSVKIKTGTDDITLMEFDNAASGSVIKDIYFEGPDGDVSFVDRSSKPGIIFADSTNCSIERCSVRLFDIGIRFEPGPSIRDSRYDWIQSVSDSDEYWLALATGDGVAPWEDDDPGIPLTPDFLYENGTRITENPGGPLAVGEWEWAANESQTFGSTVYVRLTDDADPDAKGEGFLQQGVNGKSDASFLNNIRDSFIVKNQRYNIEGQWGTNGLTIYNTTFGGRSATGLSILDSNSLAIYGGDVESTSTNTVYTGISSATIELDGNSAQFAGHVISGVHFEGNATTGGDIRIGNSGFDIDGVTLLGNFFKGSNPNPAAVNAITGNGLTIVGGVKHSGYGSSPNAFTTIGTNFDNYTISGVHGVQGNINDHLINWRQDVESTVTEGTAYKAPATVDSTFEDAARYNLYQVLFNDINTASKNYYGLFSVVDVVTSAGGDSATQTAVLYAIKGQRSSAVGGGLANVRAFKADGAVDYQRVTPSFVLGGTTINCSFGNHFVVYNNNAGAYTIDTPTWPIDGQEITITIANVSGGALGGATFTGMNLAGSFVNPADTKNRSVTLKFIDDGTTNGEWFEIHRTAADVSN